MTAWSANQNCFKTVVIGPNAKVATYHGGGSASLAAYYAVTPFDGISEKLECAPDYTAGAYSHKLLPLIGGILSTDDGQAGMKMRVYQDPPTEGATRECLDEIVLTKTELLLVDYYNDKIKSPVWYADFEGSFVGEEDCTWDLGLIVCGTAKLLINDELIIDNATEQRQGDAFFGAASMEEKGKLTIKKGEKYNVKVQFGSAPTSKLAESNVLFGGGALRIGGCKIIDDDEEIERAVALAKDADQVIICAGLNADWETEGSDRENMDMPYRLNDLISAVTKANTNTAVIVQSGTPVEMPWINEAAAVVQAWYGGNETGNCIADVLFGDTNPSGKLSLSFPKRVQDNPAYLNYRTEGGRVIYGEDVYVGYRYYEYIDLAVLFPFGHGLSYTTFDMSSLSVTETDGKLTAKVTVKNTGEVDGAEVVQVYVKPKQKAKVNRPFKEMKGFTKVQLASGESKEVSVEVDKKYAVSYWDEERDQWCGEQGEYDVLVSDTSDEKAREPLKAAVTVDETFWWTGL